MKWTRCSDRLPKYKRVKSLKKGWLVFQEDGVVSITYFHPGNWNQWPDARFTHWMDLPKKPKRRK